MSTICEESPLSDSKMDISDATNSLESTGTSPLLEQRHHNNHNNIVLMEQEEVMLKMTRTHTIDVATLDAARCTAAVDISADSQGVVAVAELIECVNDCLLNENADEDMRQTQANHNLKSMPKPKLDNRYEQNNSRTAAPAALLLLNEKHVCSATVANSHPLMSPTCTDSDTDTNSCRVPSGQTKHKFNNFPDVVPNRERRAEEDADEPLNNKMQQSKSATLVCAKNTLNSNKVQSVRLRAHSPDLLSSGSEAEISQYHAAVESNFQSVALLPNANNSNNATRAAQRKSANTGAVAADDISSLDSISNHSFDDDEDLEHNLASLSPSSSLIDGLDDDDDDDDIDDDVVADGVASEFDARTTPTNAPPPAAVVASVLPQYSAAEERRDSRNWQKITLPDGSTREIDMRVIEPYKRVLSHGGYLKAGGHNAIVIFCACHLPDRSRADYHYVMDNLFLYVVKTLEQLVTEDYVLIYLHGGTSRRNVPPFPWLKKCYQLLDRRLRKSLQHMYLVHPTFWIKSIVWMARPFVSAKFWRKLIYVRTLNELSTHIAVEKAAIPDKVKQFDAKCK